MDLDRAIVGARDGLIDTNGVEFHRSFCGERQISANGLKVREDAERGVGLDQEVRSEMKRHQACPLEIGAEVMVCKLEFHVPPVA